MKQGSPRIAPQRNHMIYKRGAPPPLKFLLLSDTKATKKQPSPYIKTRDNPCIVRV